MKPKQDSISSQSSLRKWLGLFITSLALAIIIIDTTVLNVSLKDIMRDLHADLQQMQWVITVYSLVLAALTITGGRLGDLFGRKKMFVLGALLFGVGSLIASFSTSANMLLFGWSIVEGIGAALMMPATASMVISSFQGKERAIAFGIWGGVAGASSAIGPLLGGYLTANYSWHWAFRINVAIVLIVLFGSFLVQESIDKKEARTLDVMGSILSALSMAAIVYGIVESSTYGWFKAKAIWMVAGNPIEFGGYSITAISLLVGFVLLVLFGAWELHMRASKRTPLVSLRIFKNRQFVAGVLVTSVLALGQAGIIFALPVFFQAVRSLDAFETGKLLLPMSISLLVAAPLSGLLRKKVPTRILIQVGLLASVIGTFLISRALSVTAEPNDFAVGLFVLGVGMGITSSQISNVTLSAVDPNIAGEASGINNTARQLGASLGSAIIGAVFLATISSTMALKVQELPNIPPTVKESIVSQLKDAGNNAFSEQASQPSGELSALGAALQAIKNEAMVVGGRQSLEFTMYAMAGSIVLTFLLPSDMRERVSKNPTIVAAH